MTKAEYSALVERAIADIRKAEAEDDDEIPASVIELVATVLFDLHTLAHRIQ